MATKSYTLLHSELGIEVMRCLNEHPMSSMQVAMHLPKYDTEEVREMVRMLKSVDAIKGIPLESHSGSTLYYPKDKCFLHRHGRFEAWDGNSADAYAALVSGDNMIVWKWRAQANPTDDKFIGCVMHLVKSGKVRAVMADKVRRYVKTEEVL